MTKESKTSNFVTRSIHQISRYSQIFYAVVIALLLTFQLDIFKDNVPQFYIINIITVLAMLALGTTYIDKILRKKNDSKPFLYCPECPNAKMRTSGKWICEECKQEFGKPKID